MLKNILVPVDGSTTAEAALPFATALAKRTGARLSLIRAADSPHAVREADDYLNDVAADLLERGFEVETGVPFGPPTSWIPAEVELRHADLIVMATHDRTGPKRWVQGSVAEAVVNHASVPVMVVRDADANELASREPLLIVPLDGSGFAEAAVPVAEQFATLLAAKIVLLGVVPSPTRAVPGESTVFMYTDSDPQEQINQTRGYLQSVASQITPRLRVESKVRVGEAAAEIAMEAQDRSAAVVVMATHGRTGLLRSILGSVAGGVVHRGTSPLLLVRPGAGLTDLGADRYSVNPCLIA